MSSLDYLASLCMSSFRSFSLQYFSYGYHAVLLHFALALYSVCETMREDEWLEEPPGN